MRRGERTSKKIRVVRGAACGPADLSRLEKLDGDRQTTATKEPRRARPGRLDLLVLTSLITSSFSLMMISHPFPSKV